MNKRYMDFVPTQSASKSSASRAKKNAPATTVRAAKRVVTTKKTESAQRPAIRRVANTTKLAAGVSARTGASASKVAFAGEKDVALGVIENVGPKFVKTDVPKRPLSTSSHFAKTGVAAVKAKKITGVRATAASTTAKKPQKAEIKRASQKAVSTYVPPKAQFINQEKVQKRPLSKNVYRKKVDSLVKEERKGPVTIIAKPEKDSHAGLVVTIILTIILGAAAGTVAFLLLPK